MIGHNYIRSYGQHINILKRKLNRKIKLFWIISHNSKYMYGIFKNHIIFITIAMGI